MSIEYTITGKAKRYADVPKGAEITSVNGRDFIGRCESCGKPILEGQSYHVSEDAVTCLKCGGPEDEW